MRIAVNIGPTGDWPAMLAAARTAEANGFNVLGFLDHYHAPKLEWPYLCGWSLYGALAMLTTRIHLVPMVIDRLNYLPGVLAKETSALSILSNGRFELGIGAGDFFEEASAWGLAVPDAATRITGLKETIEVLRRIWAGEFVNFEGEQIRLTNAACTPAPVIGPRIVVGAGGSRRLIRSAVEYADEINVYASEDVIRFARQEIEASGRGVALSVYVWDWPEDIAASLAAWEQLGVERTFLTFWHPFDSIESAVKYLKRNVATPITRHARFAPRRRKGWQAETCRLKLHSRHPLATRGDACHRAKQRSAPGARPVRLLPVALQSTGAPGGLRA